MKIYLLTYLLINSCPFNIPPNLIKRMAYEWYSHRSNVAPLSPHPLSLTALRSGPLPSHGDSHSTILLTRVQWILGIQRGGTQYSYRLGTDVCVVWLLRDLFQKVVFEVPPPSPALYLFIDKGLLWAALGVFEQGDFRPYLLRSSPYLIQLEVALDECIFCK